MPAPDDVPPPPHPPEDGIGSGPPKRTSTTSDWRASMKQAEPYLGMGMQMALSMTVFVFAGYGLDLWLDTLPWFLIGGALLGVFAVFALIFRLTAQLTERDRAAKAKKRSTKPPSADPPAEQPGR